MVTWAPDINIDLGGSMYSRLQKGHRLWPTPQASKWSLVAIWTTDFNTDPSCDRTMDMVLENSLGLNATKASCGREGHPDCHGPSVSVALVPNTSHILDTQNQHGC